MLAKLNSLYEEKEWEYSILEYIWYKLNLYSICVSILCDGNEDGFLALFGDLFVEYNSIKGCFKLNIKNKNKLLYYSSRAQPSEVCISSSLNTKFENDYKCQYSFWDRNILTRTDSTEILESIGLVCNTFDYSSILSHINSNNLSDKSKLTIYYKVILKWQHPKTKKETIISSPILELSLKCKKWKFIYSYQIYKNILIGNHTFKQKLKIKLKNEIKDGDKIFYRDFEENMYLKDNIGHLPVQIIDYNNNNDDNGFFYLVA